MIKITPSHDYWDSTFRDLMADVPYSTFTQPLTGILPYRLRGSPFFLDATPGSVVHIELYSSGRGHKDRQTTTRHTVIATNQTTLFYLQLGLGRNEVKAVSETGERFYGKWNCAHLATIQSAVSKDVYDYAGLDIQTLENQIYSPFSAILIEHLLPYQDLLPDVRSIRILSAKQSLRAITNDPATERSVRDWLASLTTGTPLFRELRNRTLGQYWEPVWHAPVGWSGMEAHVWIPNRCINDWAVFLNYIGAIPSVFKIVQSSEREIILRQNGVVEKHQFDPQGSGCGYSDLLKRLSCFDGMDLGVRSKITTRFLISVPGYPVDLSVEPCGLLGRRRLDCGVQLDRGVNLDAAYDFDPMGDGWQDHTLSGRLDSPYGAAIDTQIQTVRTPERTDLPYPFGAAVTFMCGQLIEPPPISEPLIILLAEKNCGLGGPTRYPTVTVAIADMAPMVEGDLCRVGSHTMYWRTDILDFVPMAFGTPYSNLLMQYQAGVAPGVAPNLAWVQGGAGAGASLGYPPGQTQFLDGVVIDWVSVDAVAPVFNAAKPKLGLLDCLVDLTATPTPGSDSAQMTVGDTVNSWHYSFSFGGVANDIARFGLGPAVPALGSKILFVLDPLGGDTFWDHETMTELYRQPALPGGGVVDTVGFQTGVVTTTTSWTFSGPNSILMFESLL